MVWNGKYASLDQVIEQVYRDQGYTHELDWGDAVEWSGEALGLIGAPSLYEEKITGMHPLTPHIDVTDFRAELPIDFIDMLPGGCRNKDTGQVYRVATDSFAIAAATQSYSTTTGEKEDTRSQPHTNADATYFLKNGYIYVNDETVTLELAYRAFKIDDRGFPMIPDDPRTIKCIASCIAYHTDYRLWRKNKLARDVFEHSEKEYLFYVKSAANSLRTMHPDRRESFTKWFVRLMPVINSHMSSFKYAGNQEDLNIGSGNDGAAL